MYTLYVHQQSTLSSECENDKLTRFHRTESMSSTKRINHVNMNMIGLKLIASVFHTKISRQVRPVQHHETKRVIPVVLN